MVGGRDGDGIDVLALLLEHRAKIFEALGLGERREGRRRLVLVHVAQRVDVRSGLREAFHVVRPHAAHADADDVDGVAGRAVSPAEHMRGHDGERDPDAHVADELASRDAFASHDATLPSRPPRGWAGARPPGDTGLRTRAAPPRQTRRAGPRTSAIVPASGWLRRRGCGWTRCRPTGRRWTC